MEQQNKYRVIVSERATQMLISHAAFLSQVSPEAAERLTAEFEKTANSLEMSPRRLFWTPTQASAATLALTHVSPVLTRAS